MPQRFQLTVPATPLPGHLGSYSVAVRGLGAASPIAGLPYGSLRWAPTSGQICVIRTCDLRIHTTTAGTNQTEAGIFFARGFTAPATGGTAVSLTGDRQKKRSSFPTSLVSDLRYAGGAGLTSGVRVLDPEPLFSTASSSSATTAVPIDATVSLPTDDPIVLVSGEGIELLNVVALTTTVYRYLWRLEWMEFKAGAF